MSQQTPYERLGIDVDASFEEIQAAKHRLQQEHRTDQKLIDSIEAAYDSILMDRLKMRQEGKIAIPDGIRFPEKSVQTLPRPKLLPTQLNNPTGWLSGLVEMPSSKNWAISSGALALLATMIVLPTTLEATLPMLLALGAGVAVYFLNAKINRLGRAFLLTSLGLVGSIGLAMLAINVFHLPIASLAISGDKIAALFTVVMLWLISSFLK